jgi:5-methylcytosine-specific restriction endonuclease McrBC regulatory subunit McrC
VGFFDLDSVVSGMKLVITTGYSNDLFVRMLAAAMGVHTDTSISSNAHKSDDLYSMIVHLMFLVTLKKVASTALPQKYVSMTERGYSVRGNIDINAYINYDLPAADKKLTSRYQERSDVQNIIDVLKHVVGVTGADASFFADLAKVGE